MVVWALFRPRPTIVILGAHGLALAVMVPFGYHLVLQNGEIRTLTGQLFAAGLAYFLLLNPALRFGSWRNCSNGNARKYLASVLLGLPLLLLVVRFGGPNTAVALAWIGLAGLLAFTALALANLVFLPAAAWALLRRQP